MSFLTELRADVGVPGVALDGEMAMYVCVYMCVLWGGGGEREKESEGGRERERERETERLRVCVCISEKERGRERRERMCMCTRAYVCARARDLYYIIVQADDVEFRSSRHLTRETVKM